MVDIPALAKPTQIAVKKTGTRNQSTLCGVLEPSLNNINSEAFSESGKTYEEIYVHIGENLSTRVRFHIDLSY